MTIKSKNLIDESIKNDLKDILNLGFVGIEKETLRVIESKISNSPHPEMLGSSLCNKFITTDFSEAQLELITPPNLNNRTIEFLDNIHHFVSQNIGKEILWPFSMPPVIQLDEDIPIANYGSSNLGKFKRIYRNGLSHRYGRTMQAISGIHYNYSFHEAIWSSSLFNKYSKDPRQARSEGYFNVLRNIYKMNWLIIYLFGSSPIIGKNLIKYTSDPFINLDSQSLYLPYATSLRMSDYGYSNISRSSFKVSLNSLDKYVSGIRRATNTIKNEYKKINSIKDDLMPQLNSNILQIEDEYYSTIRVKSNQNNDERQTSNLLNYGVEFIELRALDINPFDRTGIDRKTMLFLETFMIFSLFNKSNQIDDSNLDMINNNNLTVSKYGRSPNLSLFKEGTKVSLKDWGNEILDHMFEIAEILDGHDSLYTQMIKYFREQINEPEKTLSGQLIEKIISQKLSFYDLGVLIGRSNRNYYKEKSLLNNKDIDLLQHESKNSIKLQKELELDKSEPLKAFIKKKTQALDN